jgi:hypothetical protein
MGTSVPHAVLSEALSVVRRDHHERPVHPATRVQRIQQTTQLMIELQEATVVLQWLDLALGLDRVGGPGVIEGGVEGRLRDQRAVRVHVVDEEKEGACGIARSKPPERFVGDRPRVAVSLRAEGSGVEAQVLDEREALADQGAASVVVAMEPSIEAEVVG